MILMRIATIADSALIREDDLAADGSWHALGFVVDHTDARRPLHRAELNVTGERRA
jgi:hypothetical protein